MIQLFFKDIGSENFFTNFWGKKHVVFNANSSLIPNFGVDDFFNIIKKSHICFPQVACIDPAGQVPHHKYMDISPTRVSSEINFEGVHSVAEQGATVRIRNVSTYNDSVKNLREEFINSFHFNTTINAYYSSSVSRGFNAHYDIRHIFVLQLEGVKQWFFGSKIDGTPRHDFTPHSKILDDCTKENITLSKGQVLYIPPGLWHKTKTKENSLHLAIGVTMPDWHDFISGYLIYVMKKYDLLREHLPFQVTENKINFNEKYLNEHRNIIELLKNDLKKYDWFKIVKKIVERKP